MTLRDLVLATLWRAVTARRDIPHAMLGGAAIAIGSVLTIGTLKVRRRISGHFEKDAAHLRRKDAWQVEWAVSEERRRIARELREMVAHRLAVITTLADGVSVTIRKDPDVAAEATNLAATTSRQALTELRRIVGNLRDESDQPPITSSPHSLRADSTAPTSSSF